MRGFLKNFSTHFSKILALSLFFLVSPSLVTAAEATILDNPLSVSTVPEVIGIFVRFIIGFVGSGALLMFVWGGFKMIMARGNEKEVGEAKKIMTWATYGLVIIFLSYAIVKAVIGGLTPA
ncbi:MAG: pilin [bacterium]